MGEFKTFANFTILPLKLKKESEMSSTLQEAEIHEVPVDAPIPRDVTIRDPVVQSQPRTIRLSEHSLSKRWNKRLCDCGGPGCCQVCCCPLITLADLAEKSESNIMGKKNRRENVKCAGLFAYFCCWPELLCLITLLLREDYKDRFGVAQNESYKKDCCISFCCMCCAIRQMQA